MDTVIAFNSRISPTPRTELPTQSIGVNQLGKGDQFDTSSREICYNQISWSIDRLIELINFAIVMGTPHVRDMAFSHLHQENCEAQPGLVRSTDYDDYWPIDLVNFKPGILDSLPGSDPKLARLFTDIVVAAGLDALDEMEENGFFNYSEDIRNYLLQKAMGMGKYMNAIQNRSTKECYLDPADHPLANASWSTKRAARPKTKTKNDFIYSDSEDVSDSDSDSDIELTFEDQNLVTYNSRTLAFTKYTSVVNKQAGANTIRTADRQSYGCY
ncbi:hypothetical protein P154DRAFT_538583 [Amniculicola lignicola CBS 123094]|uniref:Uncharacterized protein n=1 Tax=Amniculicola lignicola CBS 123094 TaxID=1392246 RepID=A0A6A5W3C8_9PLEO|nr:hypothetical protein P154DRAFT_538583 [Amniculicola lignicola CBS 123094]